MEKFIKINWPQVQELMEIEGFRENAILDNRENAPSSRYLVSEDWLNSLPTESISTALEGIE
jgi:hypothetical protein